MSYLHVPKPGAASLAIGVIAPGLAILIELLTGLCADTFFDPLPTVGHLLLVASVPLVNLLLWLAVRDDATGPRWLAVAAGAAMAVSASYALLMLPILPIAAIAIIFFGIGLLPFAPVMTVVLAIRWASAMPAWNGRSGPLIAAGVATGFALLVAVDAPATATYVALNRYQGDAVAQRSAVRLMRNIGDRDMLLRLAYGDTARATGLVSFLTSSWADGFGGRSPEAKGDPRELYYRVTGTAFNAHARPEHGLEARRRWFATDSDLGGEAVGGRVPGLSLANSRIDGSTASAANLGYIEWTVEIANAAAQQHEARFTIDLPEGAVASRATLWVNGEPREASVAGRGAVRAAYTRVVTASRDPLLVTTDGAQRLLVQAFPILPNTRMKLRVGFTAPFVIAPDGARSLALPAIVEHNFDISPELRHNVWIAGDGMRDLRRAIDDASLLADRPRIAAPTLVAPSIRTGAAPASGKSPAIAIEQRVARTTTARPSSLTVVLDGSAGNRDAGAALADALDAIPDGLPAGLIIAAETPRKVAAAPWSPAQRERFVDAIKDSGFVAGQDNIPALAEALAASNARSTILWVHSVQPVGFARSGSALEQALDRLPALPRLIRYQAEPGRAFTLNGKRWFESARLVTPTSDPAADLLAILSGMAGTGWTVTRAQTDAPATGSTHLVRLWAADRITAESEATGKPRDAGIALAHRLNLITPISGAVVLETDRDYKANDLPVPSAEDVPTIPEPGTWATLIIVALAGAWLLRQRRRTGFA